MPYPNEHACRLKSPSAFQKGSFRRITQGNLDIIIGKPTGSTTTTAQAYRYPKSKWTSAAAKKHCQKHNGSFEPASEATEDKALMEKAARLAHEEATYANLCGTCNWIVDDPKEVLNICPKCGEKAYYVPVIHTTKLTVTEAKNMHTDFKKILDQFKAHYGDKKGQKEFTKWVKKRSLDTSKAYTTTQLQKESYEWAKPLIQFLKEDKTGKTYKVDAHFAVNSMNRNIYTEDEILHAVHSLPGKHVDLNHNLDWIIDGVTILAASWEDKTVETLVHVKNGTKDAKDRDVQQAIADGIIDQVSIEAGSEVVIEVPDGNVPLGLEYTGLGFLDQDALPGIPLTRIMTCESLQESIFEELEQPTKKEVKESMEEKARNDAQRAMSHFNITPVAWAKLSDAEKQAYIAKLPARGSGGNEAFGDASFPDSCFAYVPDSAKGPKGKKSDRKLPYKNKDGTVSLSHVRNALARLNQTQDIPAAEKTRIKSMLQNILKKDNPDYKPTEAKANYCAICGTKLVSNACPNEKCSVYGKKVYVDDEKIELLQKNADLTQEVSAKTVEMTSLKEEIRKNESKIVELSKKLATITRENVKIGISAQHIEDLKEQLADRAEEIQTLRGKNEGYSEQIAKLERKANEEHKEVLSLEEKLGRKETENERLRRELNDESTKRAAAEQKALNETKECSRIKLENADILEEKAVDTRKISDLSTKLGESAKAKVALEKDNATKLREAATERLALETEITTLKEDITSLKEDISKRDNIIIDKDTTIKKAIKEQKRLYNTLKANGIYEVNSDGTLKL